MKINFVEWLALLFPLALFLFFTRVSESGQTPKTDMYSEFDLKAATLEKLAFFVDWPDDQANNELFKPFIIGVIGNTPLIRSLEIIYAKQRIKNRNVSIRIFSDPLEISDCHILFISRSERFNLPLISAQLKNKPVLLVGDTDGFAYRGVHINFYVRRDGKVRFEINKKAIQSTGLKVRFQLFSAGTLIDPQNVR